MADQFIRLGNRAINLACVQHIELADPPDPSDVPITIPSAIISFSGGELLPLTGAEADAVRRWVEQHAGPDLLAE